MLNSIAEIDSTPINRDISSTVILSLGIYGVHASLAHLPSSAGQQTDRLTFLLTAHLSSRCDDNVSLRATCHARSVCVWCCPLSNAAESVGARHTTRSSSCFHVVVRLFTASLSLSRVRFSAAHVSPCVLSHLPPPAAAAAAADISWTISHLFINLTRYLHLAGN